MNPAEASCPQAPEGSWEFLKDLQTPLWEDHRWTPRSVRDSEADLSGGLSLDGDFPDPDALLETARRDWQAFCQAGAIPNSGGYRITLGHDPNLAQEAFRLQVEPQSTRLSAADCEGIRRGLFYLEELMLISGGPFLPLGLTERAPFIKNRISRCFFGPIKRPPLNRDELTDDVDYYPDAYLNRLAHEGINGLWMSISFRDLCPSRFFPAAGQDSARRLEKLRRSVKRCARHGIRLFAFTIEPVALGEGSRQFSLSEAAQHPDLLGHREGDTQYFCTGRETGQRYLEEATRHLFRAVPDLGGLINISFGERPTHCYSGSQTILHNNCPHCAEREPAEIFALTCEAMARGMKAGSPKAELISWIYLPQFRETPGIDPDVVKDILLAVAARTPASTTLQINGESDAQVTQLGRPREVLDYSLAHVGPSAFFEACAMAAVQNGAKISAKLQVGCSHELATVPHIPVPGNLYRKYRRLRELGVSTVMQCWYFGNYPSLMNRAAGRCSFEPFPETEDEFLLALAGPTWGAEAERVVTAWKLFRDAYAGFPANLEYSYYGPSHDGLTWPLHLIPVDRPLMPSWMLNEEPSGDRIGECVGFFHSLREVRTLSERLAAGWQQGVEILLSLPTTGEEQRHEVAVAEAIGLQFRSAANILRFYSEREELPWRKPEEQSRTLDRMAASVRDEIRLGLRLAELAEANPCLGFHSEAEGYKYFPEKLRWRAALLERLLETEFEEVRQSIATRRPLFAAYAGTTPTGPMATCPRVPSGDPEKIPWSQLPAQTVPGDGASRPGFTWQCAQDGKRLFFHISCPIASPPPAPDTTSWGDGMDANRILVHLEPRRLWPILRIHVDAQGGVFHDDMRSRMDPRTRARVHTTSTHWSFVLELALDSLQEPEQEGRPIRLNIQRPHELGTPSLSWIPLHPAPPRLRFGTHNPADLGWLLFEPVRE